MNLRCIAGTTAALAILMQNVPSAAQLGPQAGNQNRQGQLNRLNNRRQAPAPKRNYLPELRTIVEALAKRTENKIVVDPALFVAAPPKAPSEETTVDRALESLSTPIKGSAWRRVYLQQSGNNLTPPADKLANSVRALDQLEQSGIVLENPSSKKATSYLKDYSVSPSFIQDLQDGQFSTKPIYILYAQTIAPEARSVEERFADLQRQQMEMMMQMSPEEMSQAMAASMQTFMNMDPGVRQQMMGNMMRAGMQMFQSMSPEQRGQLLQGFGPGFPGGPPGPPPGRP